MRNCMAILLAIHLLVSALGALGMDAAATAPAPETPAPAAVTARAEKDGTAEVLERIGAEYDPALAGTVGALRWAGTLLDGFDADGRDAAAAERAAGDYITLHGDPAALESRLLRLRLAALQLCSGEELGLVREPGRRLNGSWTARDVEELFESLFRGAGLPLPGED